MSTIYLVENKHDSETLDIITDRPHSASSFYAWGMVDWDFCTEPEEPGWPPAESDTPTLADELTEAHGMPVEVVLLTRARYDELVKAAKTTLEPHP